MDPATLEGVGADALRQGIGFLYAQAEALLSRRRKADEETAASDPGDWVEEAAGTVSGPLRPLQVDADALARLADDVEALAASLRPWAEGERTVDPADGNLLAVVDALRASLEAISRQALTFGGEQRDAPKGVAVEISTDDVVGYVVGVRAKALDGRDLRVSLDTGTVHGKVVGAELD